MVDFRYLNMVLCVLRQLKPSELYIISFEKGLASALLKAKNVELLGLYPIQKYNYSGCIVHEKETKRQNMI